LELGEVTDGYLQRIKTPERCGIVFSIEHWYRYFGSEYRFMVVF